MGLRDKYKNRDSGEFHPLDLNEANVQKIFDDCIIVDGKIENAKGVLLFSKAGGYDNPSKPMFFDRKKLLYHAPSIYYLFGQLYDVYYCIYAVTPGSVAKKYTGKLWSKDPKILMEFLHLANALDIISPFVYLPANAATLKYIKPTCSPYDKEFDVEDYTDWCSIFELKIKGIEASLFDLSEEDA